MPAQLMNCTMTDQTDIEDKREIDELKRRVAQLEAKIRAALKILEGDLTLTATRN
jgi:small-conductance mechanosensitive channel